MLHRLIVVALVVSCVADAKPRDSRLRPVDSPGAAAADDSVLLVPTPDTIRGLYVNRWAAIGPPIRRLIGLAKDTEINTLVIDVKDDRGLLLYRSSVPLARRIGADTTQPMSHRRLRELLDTPESTGSIRSPE